MNNEKQYGASLRARWRAIASRKDEDQEKFAQNIVDNNVNLLARYGIYIRDKKYQLLNVMMDEVMLDVLNGKIKLAGKKEP